MSESNGIAFILNNLVVRIQIRATASVLITYHDKICSWLNRIVPSINKTDRKKILNQLKTKNATNVIKKSLNLFFSFIDGVARFNNIIKKTAATPMQAVIISILTCSINKELPIRFTS